MWWSWKNWFLTVFTLVEHGGPEENWFFNNFYFWDGLVSLEKKKQIFNSFNLAGGWWWSWKNWFLTVSTLGGCGGPERTDFKQFLTSGVCAGLERTDFKQFLLWVGVVVLKELILNSFYFGKSVVVFLKELILDSFYVGSVWWSWKNWF